MKGCVRLDDVWGLVDEYSGVSGQARKEYFEALVGSEPSRFQRE
jgi:hypothetical protein